MIDIEICCNSVASAEEAKRGGATRIELCRDLECGGLTPSDEAIDHCVTHLGLRTYVLVRPRAGDFVYNAAELEAIQRTIRYCVQVGAAGVVVGFHCREGEALAIDTALTREMVALASPLEFTFHRAFDELTTYPHTLADLHHCGCTRVLTSGGCATAPEGREPIRRLAQEGLIGVMAGSGITSANVAELIRYTGVREVHASCKQTLPDGSKQTSAQEVQALIAQVRQAER